MIHFLYHYYLTKEHLYEGRFSKFFNWQLFKLLKYVLPVYYYYLPHQLLKSNCTSDTIVSLTSFGDRIHTTHLSIKSLLNQTLPPKKVALWLSKEEFKNEEADLPETLLKLKSYGLVIEFCEDIKAHTKYFYAFQKYSDFKIVTVDDDIIYPKSMLMQLNEKAIEFPKCIIANRVRKVEFINGKPIPYRQWKINTYHNTLPTKYLLPTGVGGVLYNSNFFSASLYDIASIRSSCLLADDIWLKANSMINGIEVVFTRKYFNDFIEIKGSQTINLYSSNVFNIDNDKQIEQVFNTFGITEELFKYKL